jgi:hypothetical protein
MVYVTVMSAGSWLRVFEGMDGGSGSDGTVKDARVLRSIPMLDAAALDAVRQWRYEPTTVDGKSVPVIMTVSLAF